MTTPVPGWPFPRVDKRRWDACSEDDRTYLQFAMDRALQECEAARARAAIFAPQAGAQVLGRQTLRLVR